MNRNTFFNTKDGQTDTQALAANKANLEANLEEALVFGRRRSSSATRGNDMNRNTFFNTKDGQTDTQALAANKANLEANLEEALVFGRRRSTTGTTHGLGKRYMGRVVQNRSEKNWLFNSIRDQHY
ncbi:hypothetical protein QE152_g38664 [Popillia japonica]|uniref:Uncharacterized protein n=1 Tax=Popillia japonica TaxID=7064 RepID=A0AAW1HW65_POPJA